MIKRALPMLRSPLYWRQQTLTAHAQSKGDQALLGALVRKGVLTEKEATEISADCQSRASTPAPKVQVGDWVKELKLSGDLRIRNQWDERTPMILSEGV